MIDTDIQGFVDRTLRVSVRVLLNALALTILLRLCSAQFDRTEIAAVSAFLVWNLALEVGMSAWWAHRHLQRLDHQPKTQLCTPNQLSAPDTNRTPSSWDSSPLSHWPSR